MGEAFERLKQLFTEPNPVITRDAIDIARAALSEDARVNVPSNSAMGKKYCRDKRKAAEAFGDRNLDALNPLQIIIVVYNSHLWLTQNPHLKITSL